MLGELNMWGYGDRVGYGIVLRVGGYGERVGGGLQGLDDQP